MNMATTHRQNEGASGTDNTTRGATDAADATTTTQHRIVLRGRKVVGGIAEGEALVTRERISGWGGIDPRTGTIIETRHPLRGQSFANKVLVFPGAKGSSGWSSQFHIARIAGCAPAAILFNEMTTKIALGAVVTHAPALTGFDVDPLDVIETGDWVKVDAERGVVEVIKRRPGEAPHAR
jgi:predicted aconitase with swiveling domain